MVGMWIPNFQASRYIEVDNYFSVCQISWTRDFVQCKFRAELTPLIQLLYLSLKSRPPNCRERRKCNLISCPKTLISQGYSELREAIKTRKVLSTDLESIK